jgi:hypothetical protein
LVLKFKPKKQGGEPTPMGEPVRSIETGSRPSGAVRPRAPACRPSSRSRSGAR